MNHLKSLEQKLRILASGEEIGLTPEEAAIYGVEQADHWDEHNLNTQQEEEYEE